MATIRVDDEVYRELQRRALAFVDSPNDVLRRVLELGAARGRRRVTLGRVGRTPDAAYRLPILQALVVLGGRASSREVLERVLVAMKGELKEIDFEPMASGQVRWASAAGFERLHMSKMSSPLIKPGSPRGVWEITKAGRLYVETRVGIVKSEG